MTGGTAKAVLASECRKSICWLARTENDEDCDQGDREESCRQRKSVTKARPRAHTHAALLRRIHFFAELEAAFPRCEMSKKVITTESTTVKDPSFMLAQSSPPNCSSRGPTTVPGAKSTTRLGQKSRGAHNYFLQFFDISFGASLMANRALTRLWRNSPAPAVPALTLSVTVPRRMLLA